MTCQLRDLTWSIKMIKAISVVNSETINDLINHILIPNPHQVT
jgi:hypothetical protein